MPDTYKVLGQSKPLLATLTDLYTVAALTQASVSSVTVCNQSATATSFRISVAPMGAVDSLAHYLIYDAPIQGNETLTFTLGITLGALDKIRCYAALANVSFSGFGVEIT